jgi:hypothetical protein
MYYTRNISYHTENIYTTHNLKFFKIEKKNHVISDLAPNLIILADKCIFSTYISHTH